MSLTANFDYCVQLGLAPVKTIFHLALKNEQLFPHNVGPFTRTLSGRTLTLRVRLIDDETDFADLEFADAKHIRFMLPFELTVQTPDSPDPAPVTSTSRHCRLRATWRWTSAISPTCCAASV